MANFIKSFVHDRHSTLERGNISFIFPSNSKVFALELENLEEIFPRCYIYSDLFGMFISSATH